MKLPCLIVVLGWVFSADLVVAAETKTVVLRVQATQKKLVLSASTRRVTVDLAKEFQGYYLNEAKILLTTETPKSRAVVLFVSGPSRAPASAQKYCGAGTEGYLVWFLFDEKWRVEKRQFALIESCFESAEGNYEVKDGRVTAAWDNQRKLKRYSLEFDKGKLERGFEIKESKLTGGK